MACLSESTGNSRGSDVNYVRPVVEARPERFVADRRALES